MNRTVTIYGPGGYDPTKPNNNILEQYEVDVPTPEPTVEDALRIAARMSADARIKAGDLPDEDVAVLSLLYDPWRLGESVSVGDLRAWDGTVVECLQAHTTQADWTPDVTPALWKVHRQTTGANPDPWVQPQGGHDAYQLGARVTYQGQVWESTINANVWEPGVHGWVLVP